MVTLPGDRVIVAQGDGLVDMIYRIDMKRELIDGVTSALAGLGIADQTVLCLQRVIEDKRTAAERRDLFVVPLELRTLTYPCLFGHEVRAVERDAMVYCRVTTGRRLTVSVEVKDHPPIRLAGYRMTALAFRQ